MSPPVDGGNLRTGELSNESVRTKRRPVVLTGIVKLLNTGLQKRIVDEFNVLLGDKARDLWVEVNMNFFRERYQWSRIGQFVKIKLAYAYGWRAQVSLFKGS